MVTDSKERYDATYVQAEWDTDRARREEMRRQAEEGDR